MLSTVGTRNLRIIAVVVCVVGALFLLKTGFSSNSQSTVYKKSLDNYPEYKASFAITRACLLNEIQASDSEQLFKVSTYIDHIKTTVSTAVSKAGRSVVKMNVKSVDVFWAKSLTVINNCAAGTDLNMVGFQNMDEIKYHIPPKVEGTACNVITLGVGRDTTAETRMLEKMPRCNFFGADPASELNEEIYSKVGKFFKTAVGPKDADLTQFVYETKNNWTHYHDKVVPTRDLYNFVREDAKLSVVDQIMIDIEKTEYDIVDKLLRKNTPEDLTFCQINIEFHPKDAEARKVYYNFLKNLIEEGHILPLKTTTLVGFDVNRLFFLNVRDSICQERFFYHTEENKP